MTDVMTTEAFSDPVLRAAVGDALKSVAPHARLASGKADLAAIAAEHWRLAAEMGWLGSAIDEAVGGLGLDALHIADICEEMGRHLFCGPFIETAVFLPALAREAHGPFADLLGEVPSGALRIAIAEIDGDVSCGGSLEIAPVEHAPLATHVVLLARIGRDAYRASIVEAGQVTVDTLQPMDPTTAIGRVRLEGRSATAGHPLDKAAMRRIMAPVHLAVAADLLGVGEAALARTVEHVRTRAQFGGPIGRFQAIKHRLADAHTALTGARLAIAHAARHADDAASAELARVIAADAAMRITADSIQFHGGMGFSWETDAHFYLKRALCARARNGGTADLRKAAGDAFIDGVIARAARETA